MAMTPIKYPLAKDTIDAEDLAKLTGWLMSKPTPHLTMGPLVEKFEKRWSEWLGVKYSVACNSGSSANLLMFALRRMLVKFSNQKVVVPATSWATTVAPAIQLGFEPLACDSDPDTFGLDLNYLEDLLKKEQPTTVIMVQVLGVPNKMNEILCLQSRYGFVLLEDACASIGSTYRSRKVGTFGDMASFSFYFGHQISTIEGGMVSTNNPHFYNLLLMLRSHGWGKDLNEETRQRLTRYHNIDNFNDPFVFYIPGFNLRSTDLNAFLGLRQLEKINWLIKRRFENHQLYRAMLGNYFVHQKYDANSTVCSIHFGMLAEDIKERRTIISALKKNGVETRIFSAGNISLHPFWTERYGKVNLPIADQIYYRGLFLPNNPSLSLDDVEQISKIVLKSAGIRN